MAWYIRATVTAGNVGTTSSDHENEYVSYVHPLLWRIAETERLRGVSAKIVINFWAEIDDETAKAYADWLATNGEMHIV